MAFCKICACGEKITFARRLGFPDNCPACGRKLVDFLTYNEDDPAVEEILRKSNGADSPEEITDENNSVASVVQQTSEKDWAYAFQLENGSIIEIPQDGCIIGRTEVGAEELAEYPSVSRQHLRVTPRRRLGVIIEDLSSYGTIVDGKRVEKNTPVRITEGSVVILCNLETRLIIKGDK